MTMIEATLVKTTTETKEKTQRLFNINTPVSFNEWDLDDDTDSLKTTDFILVSRVIAADHMDWETMIFPADKDGEVLDWSELWSVRGWEHIGTTLDNYLEAENAERLQTRTSFLD